MFVLKFVWVFWSVSLCITFKVTQKSQITLSCKLMKYLESVYGLKQSIWNFNAPDPNWGNDLFLSSETWRTCVVNREPRVAYSWMTVKRWRTLIVNQRPKITYYRMTLLKDEKCMYSFFAISWTCRKILWSFFFFFFFVKYFFWCRIVLLINLKSLSLNKVTIIYKWN